MEEQVNRAFALGALVFLVACSSTPSSTDGGAVSIPDSGGALPSDAGLSVVPDAGGGLTVDSGPPAPHDDAGSNTRDGALFVPPDGGQPLQSPLGDFHWADHVAGAANLRILETGRFQWAIDGCDYLVEGVGTWSAVDGGLLLSRENQNDVTIVPSTLFDGFVSRGPVLASSSDIPDDGQSWLRGGQCLACAAVDGGPPAKISCVYPFGTDAGM